MKPFSEWLQLLLQRKTWRWFWLLFIVLVLCTREHPFTLQRGACSTNAVGLTLTAQDPAQTICVSGLDAPPLFWELSADGNRLAYAVPNPTHTPTPAERDSHYPRPPASYWFMVDFAENRAWRIPEADNHWVSLAPNGEYVQVYSGCHFGGCPVQVFHARQHKLVCAYATENAWFTGQCGPIQLANGQRWDIAAEVNTDACITYYGKQAADCWKATYTPQPTITPTGPPYPVSTSTTK